MSIDYRYELKFILDDSKLSDAMRWMCTYTHAREIYNKRKVNTLYFDDADFTFVRDNLAGVSNRKKIRLRWYGCEDVSSPSFQTKIRNGRLGYKKSYPLKSLENSLMELNIKDILSECEKELRKQHVILDEYLAPTLQVSYDREYYADLDGIRITIDQNIQYYGLCLHQKLNETFFAPSPYKVMEIKFEPHLKTRIAELIRPLHITPKRHSKYLAGLAMLGKVVYI